MSLQLAYIIPENLNKNKFDSINIYDYDRININDYDEKLHKNKIFCMLGHELMAKRGDKKSWHFCHRRNYNDEECSKHMGGWHIWWQNRVIDDFIEVIMKKDGKIHIADMVNANNIIIEFQKSVIADHIIKERELFYNKIIWIFGCEMYDFEIIKQEGRFVCITIKSGSLYFTCTTKRTFLDFNRRMLIEVVLFDTLKKSDTLIYGQIVTLKEFDDEFMQFCLKGDADKRLYNPTFDFDNTINLTFEETDMYKCYMEKYNKIMINKKSKKKIKK